MYTFNTIHRVILVIIRKEQLLYKEFEVMQKIILTILGISITTLFLGCGEGSSSNGLTKGYLLDSPIVGVDYRCGDIIGTTKKKGKFECEEAPVTFFIGSYIMGSISSFTDDGDVYLQDLLGLPRTNFTDPELIDLARLIQSLDDDGDIEKAITIPSDMAKKFGMDAKDATLEELAVMAGVTLVSASSALEHLYGESVIGREDGNGSSISHSPVAYAQTLTLAEDSSKSITLSATDPDADTLVYTIVSSPTHGALSGTVPSLTYTPTKDYNGADSFTFKVSDGIFNSATVTINLTITKVNDAPVAIAKSVKVNEDSSANAVTLTGTDVDGDTLTYLIVASPSHGTLGGTGANKTYTPTANYKGTDSFTFKVSDGVLSSVIATVSISISNLNDAPVISKANLKTSFKDHNIVTGDSNFTMAFAIDLDDDHDIDIVTASDNNDRVAWFKNNGSEVFTDHNISKTADNVISVYALDVDGDSIKDVLSASKSDDRIVWYKNNGSEVFTEHNISKNADGAHSVFAMDIDGDNGIDILSASADDNNVTWYENDSSENFTKHTIGKNLTGARYAYSTDFNGDGHIDVLAVSGKDDDINRTVWYQNNGSEVFTEHNISKDINNEVHSIFAINMDGDSDKDIIISAGDRVVLYENNGTNIGFKEHNLTMPTGIDSIHVTAMDIDGDSDIDIFSSGVWFENNGTVASPDFRVHLIEKKLVAFFSLVDLDDDNDTDIIAPLHNNGSLMWYENLGEDTFYVYENKKNVTTITATDSDGDTLTYGVTGTDSSKFDVNSSTGVLSFKTAPNYESPTDSGTNNTYDISVTVSDGNATTTLPVKVTVEDIEGA